MVFNPCRPATPLDILPPPPGIQGLSDTSETRIASFVMDVKLARRSSVRRLPSKTERRGLLDTLCQLVPIELHDLVCSRVGRRRYRPIDPGGHATRTVRLALKAKSPDFALRRLDRRRTPEFREARVPAALIWTPPR